MSDFWSRRRASVEAEEAADRRTEEESRGAALDAGAETDADLCAALGLPDPDALGPGDDVSAFMARVVPERLRRRALRVLWARDPRLANLDGLVDYGGDFTDAGLRAGVVATVYEVGRGAARRIDALAHEAEGEPVAADIRRPEGDGAIGPEGGRIGARGDDDGREEAPSGDAMHGDGATDGSDRPAGEGGTARGPHRAPDAARTHAEGFAVGGPDPSPHPVGDVETPGRSPHAETGNAQAEAAGEPAPRRRMRFTFAQDAA